MICNPTASSGKVKCTSKSFTYSEDGNPYTISGLPTDATNFVLLRDDYINRRIPPGYTGFAVLCEGKCFYTEGSDSSRHYIRDGSSRFTLKNGTLTFTNGAIYNGKYTLTVW